MESSLPTRSLADFLAPRNLSVSWPSVPMTPRTTKHKFSKKTIGFNLPSTAQSPHQDLQPHGPKSQRSSNSSRESSSPTGCFSVISLSPVGRSGFADSRTLCALPVQYETPIPDPRCQWSTLICIGDFPIGKSTDERWRFTHLSNSERRCVMPRAVLRTVSVGPVATRDFAVSPCSLQI
jgi:hypothetical protein